MAVPDFPSTATAPFYGSNPSKEFRILTASFGDGYSQRVPDGLNTEIEAWEMAWDVVTEEEKNIITNFLDARGGYGAFGFVMPGETVKKKWVCRKYQARPLTYGFYALTATFERVYDL